MFDINKEHRDISDSGLLELYVLGMSDSMDSLYIEFLKVIDPRVEPEIKNLEQVLELVAIKAAIKPGIFLKKEIFQKD